MYDRAVDGKELHFQVSGKLWNRSLVMMDEETGSLWSHLLGESVQGELLGSKLHTISSVITSWEDWKATYPNTVVMIMPGRLRGQEYDRTFYRSHRSKPFVIGYAHNGASKHYPFKTLRKHPLLNESVSDTELLLYFEENTGAAWAFRRTVDDRTLTFFSDNGTIVDNETNSIWDPRSGKSTSGVLKGTKLEPVVVIPSYEFAWKKFHPNSRVYSPDAKESSSSSTSSK